jgi:hypothetical protein
MVTVDAGIFSFSGVVQADTLIANAVIGASRVAGTGEHLVKGYTTCWRRCEPLRPICLHATR